jgi:hypothetical protein
MLQYDKPLNIQSTTHPEPPTASLNRQTTTNHRNLRILHKTFAGGV